MKDRHRHGYQIHLAHVLTAALLVAVGCGGESKSTLDESVPSTTEAPAVTATARPAVIATALSTATASAGPEATPRGPAPLPASVAVVLPPDRPDAMLGDSNIEAVKAFTSELTSAGLDLTGLDIYVFPVIAVEPQWLVVFDIAVADADPLISSLTASDDKLRLLLQQVSVSPSLAAAGVDRLVINMRANSPDGPEILTVTLSMAALARIQDGTMTEQEQKEQVLFQIKRGGHQ